MSFNLVRNSRLWFTTNVNSSTGALSSTSGSTNSTNTFELLVLDGFSFSQSTQQTTIQISEAGNEPIRGQRAFNTALDPVEVTFSTYICPTSEGSGNANGVGAPEQYLWNAIFSDTAVDSGTTLATGITNATYTASSGILTINGSGINSFTTDQHYTIVGVTAGTGTNSEKFNSPVKVVSRSASQLVLQYINAPAQDTVTVTTSTKLVASSWSQVGSAIASPGFGQVTTATSNKNQLQKFALIFQVDDAIYSVENCAVDQASIDFALDGIATIAWTVRGTKLNYLDEAQINGDKTVGATFSGTGLPYGTAKAAVTATNYITNKLSTMNLNKQIGGGGTAYSIALTGGNITIANNITYITPSNLGVVNKSIGYFTGARSISGNVTAYLRTGTSRSAQLLKDIISDDAAETKFYLKLDIGGSSNSTKVELLMPGVVLQIPTVETADVISTTINFTAQGHTSVAGTLADYAVDSVNDLRIRYYSAA